MDSQSYKFASLQSQGLVGVRICKVIKIDNKLDLEIVYNPQSYGINNKKSKQFNQECLQKLSKAFNCRKAINLT